MSEPESPALKYHNITLKKRVFNNNRVDGNVKNHNECVRHRSICPAVMLGCWVSMICKDSPAPPPPPLSCVTCDSWECHTKHSRLNYQTESSEWDCYLFPNLTFILSGNISQWLKNYYYYNFYSAVLRG